MAYDRADWHYGGEFPENLPNEAGGTHIGMFLAWTIINNLEGKLHREESNESLQKVRARQMTGREFLFKECDEKFTNESLNKEGNDFAKSYYESSSYFEDYAEALALDAGQIYFAEDSWENYDRIAKVLDQRFAEWKLKRVPKKPKINP